ncbi:hypothetical protein BR93DRAFT_125220 [Coniochaeta sp. PMI_546]|nr:hypothetical protein BR93DRAFT_125220 [Coniochaeta sp. PMI_546]
MGGAENRKVLADRKDNLGRVIGEIVPEDLTAVIGNVPTLLFKGVRTLRFNSGFRGTPAARHLSTNFFLIKPSIRRRKFNLTVLRPNRISAVSGEVVARFAGVESPTGDGGVLVRAIVSGHGFEKPGYDAHGGLDGLGVDLRVDAALSRSADDADTHWQSRLDRSGLPLCRNS